MNLQHMFTAFWKDKYRQPIKKYTGFASAGWRLRLTRPTNEPGPGSLRRRAWFKRQGLGVVGILAVAVHVQAFALLLFRYAQTNRHIRHFVTDKGDDT